MASKYWAVIFLLGMGWGASFFFNEILLRELGPLSVSLGRVGVGALGCWIWIFVSRGKIRVPLPMIAALLLFGVVQYALPLAIYPVAQQYITSGAAGIINAMTPVMVVLVSHIWPGGERVTVLKAFGVVSGFIGIVFLTLPALQASRATATGGSEFWAMIFCMGAPVCYAVAINFMRRFAAMDRVTLTAWSLTLGALALAPVALMSEGLPVITRVETWGALAVIGFVLTSASFIVLFWLIPIVGATAASTITFVAPVSAMFLGVFILGEVLTEAHLAGMAAIFTGLVLIDGRLPRRFMAARIGL